MRRKFLQSGIVSIGISDHELIYCTRKVRKAKVYAHKQISYQSMKSYSKEKFIELLSLDVFPDYSHYTDIDQAYEDFVGRVSSAVNKIAPIKEVRVKQGSPEWFDGEILEKIKCRDKLLQK